MTAPARVPPSFRAWPPAGMGQLDAVDLTPGRFDANYFRLPRMKRE